MSQQIPISEVLNRAADSLQRDGWTQHALGYPGEPRCAIGALMSATGVDRDYTRGAAWMTAGVRLGDYIDGNVADWNNARERTASEVIEVLRATAVIEAAREQQPAPVAVTA